MLRFAKLPVKVLQEGLTSPALNLYCYLLSKHYKGRNAMVDEVDAEENIKMPHSSFYRAKKILVEAKLLFKVKRKWFLMTEELIRISEEISGVEMTIQQVYDGLSMVTGRPLEPWFYGKKESEIAMTRGRPSEDLMRKGWEAQNGRKWPV